MLDFEDTAADSRTSSSGRRASELRLEELACVYEATLSSSTFNILEGGKSERGLRLAIKSSSFMTMGGCLTSRSGLS